MSNLKKKLARVEIMDQVCDIVKKFHSLPQGYRVTGESKLTSLNAESTFKFATPHGSSELFSSMRFVREILEQQFGIKIEEVHANSITTVSDLVVLIEELINKKTKLEIVDKVCKIVKGVFALPEDPIVTEESKFEALGGYSPLNMVWIMFTISKEFGIAIDADHASSITTVSDAAHLVEELIKKKEAPYSEDIGNDQQHYDQVKQVLVDILCKTVKKEFGLPEDSIVTAESKFAALGGYSPQNMVWLIEPLEEQLRNTIEEVNARRLTTVADAAYLIIELLQKSNLRGHNIFSFHGYVEHFEQARAKIMDHVCGIVKKFHSLPQDYRVTGESKLTSLIAESTFKFATPHGSSEFFSIMRFVREMLELQRGIKIEEVNANSITTVSDLVVLIEELINKKTKLEIVDKVCKIVKCVFALPEDSIVTEESKFEALGGYSPLNMVWIMFTISKEFGIAIDADHASSITTVSDAAHLVEELIKKKEAPYSEDIGNDQQHYDQVKQLIVDIVCKTVKKAFGLPEDSIVTAESKFAALGGYSPLNMVWVMGPLGEEFGITIEEVNAKRLTTVADASDLIIELIQKEIPNAEEDTLEASKSEDNGIRPAETYMLDMKMSDREFGEKPSENTVLEERVRRIKAALLAHHRS